jgi:hypothetical protein
MRGGAGLMSGVLRNVAAFKPADVAMTAAALAKLQPGREALEVMWTLQEVSGSRLVMIPRKSPSMHLA